MGTGYRRAEAPRASIPGHGSVADRIKLVGFSLAFVLIFVAALTALGAVVEGIRDGAREATREGLAKPVIIINP